MKLLLLVPVVVIAATFIGQAVGNTCYSFLPMWHSCVGTTALNEGTTYAGTWEWNVATGEGTLQRTDGSSYSGDVVDGQPNGEGEETLANGDRYAGSVVDGTWSGKGVLTLVNGDTYTGDFANGQRSGTGTETTESGESYTGRFENDQRHGQGQLVRENRDIYTGEFANGEPHGRGVLERAVSGAIIRGDFENGSPVLGYLAMIDGANYYGGLMQNEEGILRHGQGTFTWPDGRQYVGEWADDSFVD